MPESEMPLPTSGHTQALNELSRIIEVSRDGIGIDGDPDLIDDGVTLRVDMWVDGTGAFVGEPGGCELERREPFTLYIPAEFPFRSPTVWVPHRRFAGLPHVQWGRYICLYASGGDWDPGEGMWGFLDRLLTWCLRAAHGRLIDPALPWHPPVTYWAGLGGTLVLRADLPDEYEHNEAPWIGWGLVTPMGEDRFELVRWVPASVANGVRCEAVRAYLAESDREEGACAAPLVALPEPLGFEYPITVGGLAQALSAHNIDIPACNDVLQAAITINQDVAASHPAGAPPPLVLLIGSPAAVRAAVPRRVAYVAAWRIPHTRASSITDATLLTWMKVYDQRLRSTTRRDTTRPVQWLAGRQVLILGCGALGAPIAEYCVRAGVGGLTVVDNGTVNPGILVRQPYQYTDIGRSKAKALSERLSAIAPHTAINAEFRNALTVVADGPPADLIIDATASRSVAAMIERLRWMGSRSFPPILSVMVGHRSEHGLATLALPGATGAGADILRRFAIAASSGTELTDVLDDFYPDPPRSDVFQPEPGCSDPTFVGSAADSALLAAQLLNNALTVLTAASTISGAAHQPTRSASVVRLADGLHPQAVGARLQWGNDVVYIDGVHLYQIRIEPTALAGIRREVLRAAAVNSEDETAGLLLGQVDRGCRVVWVSDAYGLPPGSQASPDGVQINVSDLSGVLAERRHSSRGMINFIGAWHSHPYGPVTPSDRDRKTMDDLVNGQKETLPQALLMVVGGRNGRWLEWLQGRCRPDMHVEMFFPS